MEMKASFIPIFFLVLLLGFSTGQRYPGGDGDGDGDSGGEGGLPPTSPFSSVPCASNLNFCSNLIPFNTSSLSCNSAWSSQGFMLMYEQSGPSLWSFILLAPDNNAYISIGFSTTGRMIGASAIAEWVFSSGSGTVEQYYLGGYSSGQCPPDKGSLQLVPGSATIISESSKLCLAFQLNTVAPESNLIFAVGPQGSLPGSDNYLPQHQAMTSTSINYAKGQNRPSSPSASTANSPSPSSSGSTCSTSLNVNTKLIQFDTSTLKCYKAWSSQDFILMFKQSGPNLWSFILTAPDNNAYISIGFSSNGRMVGTSAIAGWISSSGPGIVKQYSLGGYRSGQCPPDQGILQLVQGTSMIISQSSRLYLAFQLNSTTQPQSHLIFAVGPSGRLPSSDYYLPTHQDMTATTINYATGQSPTSGGWTFTSKRLHGFLGMLAWGILVPIGVAAARYCKHWDPFWFYAHISVQGTGFSLGLACTVSGFRLVNKVGVNIGTHRAVGIFILVLGCLQVMALLARPDNASKIRRYWNWCHHYVGRAAIVCAIGNIFYGFCLAKESRSWSVGYGIFLGMWLAVCLVLEVRMWLRK